MPEIDLKTSGGFAMKLVSRIVLCAVMAAVAGALVLAQGQGSISGRVVDRDGKTPVAGITIRVESLITERGQMMVRERLETKTGRNGEYSLSGVYQGRVRLSLIQNGQVLMVLGDAIGDERVVAPGLELRASFDMSKAPAAPVATAAPAAPTSGVSAADRDAARARLEKEMKDQLEMEAAFKAGQTAFTEKRFDDAIASFKKALEKDPKIDVIWANLARSQDSARQYDEAIASYEQAIKIKPESNYYLNLGVVQFSAGKVEEGTASLKKSVELNPANAGLAYYNLGATMVNRGKNEEAAAAFKEAIRLDPNYANAYYELAVVNFGKQETIPQAIPLLEQYLKLAPTGPNASAAKALLDAAKATAPTTFTSPDAGKGKNKE
jgi:tetratricopeptide (TPR) repeat protein